MRITKEQAEANRRKIVDTAATLFLERGFDGVGIADIMKAAGFTHGGFYNHFKSKQALESEASARAFELRPTHMARPSSLTEYLENYLSELHLKRPDRGCPVAALGADAAREPDAVKKPFADGVAGMLAVLEACLADEGVPESDRRAFAVATLSQMVGAVVVARALPQDDPIRLEMLASTLARALAEARSGGA